jgi:hypothetical protein
VPVLIIKTPSELSDNNIDEVISHM